MIEKAIEKINTEMQKNPGDVYTEIVGHYIIDRCTDEVTAARVAAEGKSLLGAMEAVVDNAKKKQKGNTAILLPADVFGAVDGYFGLQADEAAQEGAMAAACGAAQTPVKPPVAKKVALAFEDFV